VKCWYFVFLFELPHSHVALWGSLTKVCGFPVIHKVCGMQFWCTNIWNLPSIKIPFVDNKGIDILFWFDNFYHILF
jgi:hypothetical protein